MSVDKQVLTMVKPIPDLRSYRGQSAEARNPRGPRVHPCSDERS